MHLVGTLGVWGTVLGFGAARNAYGEVLTQCTHQVSAVHTSAGEQKREADSWRDAVGRELIWVLEGCMSLSVSEASN